MAVTSRVYNNVTLQASTTETATGNGTAVRMQRALNAVVLVLDVTAAATAAADTLNVFVQTKADGTNWLDVAHFTEVLGNGGAKRYVTKLTAALATAEFENGTALGAAAVRNIIGDDWRVRWAVVSDTAPSFTFSVTANAF